MHKNSKTKLLIHKVKIKNKNQNKIISIYGNAHKKNNSFAVLSKHILSKHFLLNTFYQKYEEYKV